MTDVRATFAEVSERLRSDAARHLDVPAVSVTQVSLAERPASWIARYTAADQRSAQGHRGLYAKVFKVKDAPGALDAMRARVKHEFDTLTRVQAVLSQSPGLGVVPPVACYPDLLATVTEEVTGPTLLEYLPRRMTWWASSSSAAEAADVLHRCGRLLRRLQDVDPPGPRVSVAELSAYVDLRLERLEREGGEGFQAPWRARVREHVERLGAEVGEDDLVARFAHADLALANVLVTPERIVMLDFAMARPALRFLDLARLSLQLDLLAVKPHVRRGTVHRLQRALREGFEPGLSAEHPLFRLLTLLHRVNHLGSLTLKPARFPESLYNAAVARAHRRWLGDELQRGAHA